MSSPGSDPLLLNSLVSNVEATLTFTLASKLVDMTLSLQQQQENSSSTSSAAWILGAICLMVLSISSAWEKGQGDHDDSTGDEDSDQLAAAAATRDLVSMLNQTLVLAFSRIVLLQVRNDLFTFCLQWTNYLYAFKHS